MTSGPDTLLYALGVAMTPAGTWATSSGTGAVVGTGSAALTEIYPNDVVILNGQTFEVVTRADNTHLTVTPNAAATASGLTMTGFDLHTTIQQRGIYWPKGVFIPYSQPLDLGNGGLRGGGWPMAEWRWGFLPRDQRDLLRLIMDPGLLGLASALMYLKTTTNEQGDVYSSFRSRMIWPQGETKDTTRRVPFAVRFRALAFPGA